MTQKRRKATLADVFILGAMCVASFVITFLMLQYTSHHLSLFTYICSGYSLTANVIQCWLFTKGLDYYNYSKKVKKNTLRGIPTHHPSWRTCPKCNNHGTGAGFGVLQCVACKNVWVGGTWTRLSHSTAKPLT